MDQYSWSNRQNTVKTNDFMVKPDGVTDKWARIGCFFALEGGKLKTKEEIVGIKVTHHIYKHSKIMFKSFWAIWSDLEPEWPGLTVKSDGVTDKWAKIGCFLALEGGKVKIKEGDSRDKSYIAHS